VPASVLSKTSRIVATCRGSNVEAAGREIGHGQHERLRNQLVDVRESLRVASLAAVDARIERLARDAESA
jgi:uncharacterized membrane protein